MKLKSKKVIQIFLPIMLFGTLYNIKAMSLNNMNFENLPYDMIGEILSYIANPKSIADVTQANIDKIKALRKDEFNEDESNENKLSGIVKFLEALKKSTCDYLGKFKYKPTLLVEEAVKLNTEFSKECLKELINTDSEKYSSEIDNKVDGIFTRSDKIETVKFLIEAGVNPNVQNSDGDTALINIAWRGKKEIAKLLLENGAKTDIQNNFGYTALMVASIWYRNEMIELLLANGAKIDIQNKDGNTALMLVASEGRKEMVELLLANGARTGIQNKDGKNAAEIALDEGYKDIANLIKNYGKSTLSSALNKGYEYVSGFIKKYSE